jgi:hypothetical protein
MDRTPLATRSAAPLVAEARRLLQVSWPFVNLRGTHLRRTFPKQTVEIKPPTIHRQAAVRRPRPCFLWSVPIQFHAVVVRITQVNRFANAVIARSIQRNAGGDQSAQSISQRTPGGIKDGGMIQARCSGQRR